MKIIFSIAHPKHVHIFKHVISSLSKNNHQCYCYVIEKDVTTQLLDYYNISYDIIGKNKSKTFDKIISSLSRFLKIFKKILKSNPDLIVGQADPFFALVAFILRKKYIVLPDTETAYFSNKIAIPLANSIIASDSYTNNFKNILRVNSYLELSYLHPETFHPNDVKTEYLSLNKEENYIIVRFVSWNAQHDIGHNGISDLNKNKAIYEFSKYGKVFITSEAPLPDALKKYEIQLPPEKMHYILAKASLFYGESATMAAESAILGTPSIYVNDAKLGYINDLEKKYSLLYSYRENNLDQENSIKKGVELLSTSNIKQQWKQKRKIMLKEKINFYAFLRWFIENYPESHKIIKRNPAFQNQFK